MPSHTRNTPACSSMNAASSLWSRTFPTWVTVAAEMVARGLISEVAAEPLHEAGWDDDERHQHHGEPPAAMVRQVGEVLPPEPHDEGQGQEHRGEDGELLDDLVRAGHLQRLVGGEDRQRELARFLDHLGEPGDVIGEVAEVLTRAAADPR